MNKEKNIAAFQTLRHTMIHEVIEVRHLTESTFVVKTTRGDIDFQPGQHLSVGPKNDLNMREYSIYSSIDADFLEILVIEVKEGLVSKALKILKPNKEIKIEGPFGNFTIEETEKDKPLYMIATGTGISPYHCFAESYPSLTFTVLHGVRHIEELYEKETFNKQNIEYIPCLSQDKIETLIDAPYAHPFQGRVTTYIKEQNIDKEGIFFLCGNCDMIYEVYDILQTKGVPAENIKAEVYF